MADRLHGGYYPDDQTLKRQREDEEAKNRARRRDPASSVTTSNNIQLNNNNSSSSYNSSRFQGYDPENQSLRRQREDEDAKNRARRRIPRRTGSAPMSVNSTDSNLFIGGTSTSRQREEEEAKNQGRRRIPHGRSFDGSGGATSSAYVGSNTNTSYHANTGKTYHKDGTRSLSPPNNNLKNNLYVGMTDEEAKNRGRRRRSPVRPGAEAVSVMTNNTINNNNNHLVLGRTKSIDRQREDEQAKHRARRIPRRTGSAPMSVNISKHTANTTNNNLFVGMPSSTSGQAEGRRQSPVRPGAESVALSGTSTHTINSSGGSSNNNLFVGRSNSTSRQREDEDAKIRGRRQSPVRPGAESVSSSGTSTHSIPNNNSNLFVGRTNSTDRQREDEEAKNRGRRQSPVRPGAEPVSLSATSTHSIPNNGNNLFVGMPNSSDRQREDEEAKNRGRRQSPVRPGAESVSLSATSTHSIPSNSNNLFVGMPNSSDRQREDEAAKNRGRRQSPVRPGAESVSLSATSTHSIPNNGNNLFVGMPNSSDRQREDEEAKNRGRRQSPVRPGAESVSLSGSSTHNNSNNNSHLFVGRSISSDRQREDEEAKNRGRRQSPVRTEGGGQGVTSSLVANIMNISNHASPVNNDNNNLFVGITDEEAKNRGRRSPVRPGAEPVSSSVNTTDNLNVNSSCHSRLQGYYLDDKSLKQQREDEEAKNRGRRKSPVRPEGQGQGGTSSLNNADDDNHNLFVGSTRQGRSRSPVRTRSRSPLVGDVHVPPETDRREKMRLAFFSSSTASQRRIDNKGGTGTATENKRDSLEKSASMPRFPRSSTTSNTSSTAYLTQLQNALNSASAGNSTDDKDGGAPRTSLERSISMPKDLLIVKKNELQGSGGGSSHHRTTSTNGTTVSGSHRSSHRSSGRSGGSWRGSLRASLRGSLSGSWTNSLKSFLSGSSRLGSDSFRSNSSNHSHTRLNNVNDPPKSPRSPKSPRRQARNQSDRMPLPAVQAMWGVAGGGAAGADKSSNSMGLDASLLRELAATSNNGDISQMEQQQILMEKAAAMGIISEGDALEINGIAISEFMDEIQSMPRLSDPNAPQTSPPPLPELSFDNNGQALKSSLVSAARQSSTADGLMMHPGAYAGNSDFNYREANQVPEYSNALGPSTHHGRQDTNTTTDDETQQRKSDFSAAEQRKSDYSSKQLKDESSDVNDDSPSFNGDELEDVDLELNLDESATPLPPADFAVDAANKEYDQKLKRVCYILAVVILVIVVVSIVVPVVVLMQKDDNPAADPQNTLEGKRSDGDNKETEAPTSSWVVPNMLPVTIQAIEEDIFSPQFLAYDWVSKDPNWDTFDDWQKQQRFALAALYYSLLANSRGANGAYYNPNYYTEECRWIISNDPTCNDEGEVILFSIPYAPLDFKGSIPPQIGFLSSLEIIEFQNFPFDSETFQELFATETLDNFPTSSIREFTIRDSQLQGQIPSELGLLTGLTSLDLQGNNLESTIPSQLGMLTNLEHVFFSSNLLSGSIPEELGKLSLLTNFQIEGNPELLASLPAGFCTNTNADDVDNNRTLAASFESIQTDWCDSSLDCCADAQ